MPGPQGTHANQYLYYYAASWYYTTEDIMSMVYQGRVSTHMAHPTAEQVGHGVLLYLVYHTHAVRCGMSHEAVHLHVHVGVVTTGTWMQGATSTCVHLVCIHHVGTVDVVTLYPWTSSHPVIALRVLCLYVCRVIVARQGHAIAWQDPAWLCPYRCTLGCTPIGTAPIHVLPPLSSIPGCTVPLDVEYLYAHRNRWLHGVGIWVLTTSSIALYTRGTAVWWLVQVWVRYRRCTHVSTEHDHAQGTCTPWLHVLWCT